MRKLTVRQTAVLAAIERHQLCSLLDLWEDFPDLPPSTVERVIQALERRELVVRAGDPEKVFLGEVFFAPVSRNGVEGWLDLLLT